MKSFDVQSDLASISAADRTPMRRLKSAFLGLVCILSLMWTPLVNGQAFFFDDTTNYIRAADMALYLASGKRVSTVWTERYAGQLPGAPAASQKQVGAEKVRPTHNDISTGLVMAGRSPYIGALMYLGYLTSDFWLFVLMQAALSYFLIVLVLKRFGIRGEATVTAITLLIAGLTAISYYNGLLLADSFAAFGILAFLLLATPGKLTKAETTILGGILAIAVVSHLTHIVILASMLVVAAALSRLKVMLPVPRRAWLLGVGALVLGFASTQVTAIATEAALGKKPQLLPLLTARFIADGPGREFIKAGCEGNRFQICRVRLGRLYHESEILSATEPGVGTYLVASPEERMRMNEEDKAFALAVFRFDPVNETAAVIKNSFRQLTWVQYDGLNRGCFDREGCWTSLPTTVRNEFKDSLSGRNAWPQGLMNRVLQAFVAASLISLLFTVWQTRARPNENCFVLRSWITVTAIAMVACAAFGGGVVDPQYRYIGRLIWLIPLYAMISLYLCYRPSANHASSDHPRPVGSG